MPAALSRLPLVPLLAVSALLELLLARVGTHLVSSLLPKADPQVRIMELGGSFLTAFSGLLALSVFTWAAVVLIRDRNLLRIPDRMAFTFLSALFLPLCAMGLLFRLPRAVVPLLNLSYGLLLLSLVVGFFRRPAPLRGKLGILYLCAPLLLYCIWLLTQQIPALAPTGSQSEIPIQLFQIGEHLLVVGAFAAFLFFAPFPRRVSFLAPLPLTFAALSTAVIALFIRHAYPEAQQAAYQGLGINLPPPSIYVLMHLASLFFFLLTVAQLLGREGHERSTGLGLILTALPGYQLQLPGQFLLSLLGMMQLCRATTGDHAAAPEAATRVPRATPDGEAWTGYLQRLATACSRPPAAGEAMLLQHAGPSTGYVRGSRDGLPFVLRLQPGVSGVEQLEITVGDPPKETAPLSLHRQRGRLGRRVARPAGGPRAPLGTDDLDRAFVVRDATGQAGAILGDPELRPSLLHLIHGALALWPGEGLRYVARPGASGWPVPLAELSFSSAVASTDEIEALMALLFALARRAGVRR